MCGIFGYIGKENALDVCLKGIKRLEYRGYDSAGIGGIADGKLYAYKEIGKVQSLEDLLLREGRPLEIAVGHTRWATCGEITRDNAHPHLDTKGTVAVVHNGIIENHRELREQLLASGVRFNSQTDTEVVAQLIAHLYEGDLLQTVQRATSLLRGIWGLAVIHANHPDSIVVCAHEIPVALALDTKRSEAFLTSDINALPHSDLDLLFLREGEVALLQRDGIQLFDRAATLVAPTLQKIGIETQIANKGEYDHFMLKEIFEQPQTIAAAMHDRLIEEYGTAEFDQLSLTSQDLHAVRRILILACGSSWHAGCVAASLLEEMARIPTHAEIASEFRYKNPIVSEDTLVIAISQSGETLDTISAVREAKRKGAKVLAICNVRHSALSREADDCIYLRAGPEICVCSTKAFTSQLTVLSLFALLMGRLRHLSKEEGQSFLTHLRQLPEQVAAVLSLKDKIQEIAKRYAHFEHFFFLGRNTMYPTSLEAALKLKEITYLNASGYAAGEMKHGPIALVSPRLAVVGMCGNRRTYEKMMSNLLEVKARGSPVIAFAPHGAHEVQEIANDTLFLPETIDELATIPYTVAAQLLAYYVAIERGTDIDQPRNLAKSVTVE